MFIQLYITKVPIGSGENFPDPDSTKKVQIRIRNPAIGTESVKTENWGKFGLPRHPHQQIRCGKCGQKTVLKLADNSSFSGGQWSSQWGVQMTPAESAKPPLPCPQGLRIRSIFGRIRIQNLAIRIFKTGNQETKKQFNHLKFFSYQSDFLNIFMLIFFSC